MPDAVVRYRSVVADSARWKGFPFRDGDIVISTPSKCGTTWTQMICALLVFQTPDFALPLAEISPWLDMLTTDRDDLVAALEVQPHRRFIKTHTPLDGLPFDDRVTYVCVGRDPRDAGFSWSNHLANMDMNSFFAARRNAVGLADLDELPPDGPQEVPPTEIERFWQWVTTQRRPTSRRPVWRNWCTTSGLSGRPQPAPPISRCCTTTIFRLTSKGKCASWLSAWASTCLNRGGHSSWRPPGSARCAAGPTTSFPTGATTSGATIRSSSTAGRAGSGTPG
jgi:hypothetical protein